MWAPSGTSGWCTRPRPRVPEAPDRPPPAYTEALMAEQSPTPSQTVLAGRYVLGEELGRGGMASVWRATDEVLDRPVAVKILHEHLAEDPTFRDRFNTEALAAARLTHPSIVN